MRNIQNILFLGTIPFATYAAINSRTEIGKFSSYIAIAQCIGLSIAPIPATPIMTGLAIATSGIWVANAAMAFNNSKNE